MAGLVKLLRQKWHPPAAETASFAGRTVLVTGATTGLGLEAAKKIAYLEPEVLIITARGTKRGERAKSIIQNHINQTKPARKCPPIHLLLLNMSQFELVTEFAREVTAQFPTLDTVVLNAGTASKGWIESPDGWEEQLQKPHIEVVTSGLARVQTAESLADYLKGDDMLSQFNSRIAVSDKSSMSEARKQYARSKMLMEINMKHIAELPFINARPESPRVIINSACPGLCKTDLAREMATSLWLKILISLFFMIFGRSAERGSNTLVSALTRGIDGHGKMWKDDQYQDGGTFLESAEAKTFGDKVWYETCKILRTYDPSLTSVLQGHH